MDDELYRRAMWTNSNIVRLDGRTKENIEQILKAEKTRLKREQWTVAKAKASMRVFTAEKNYWKELSKANTKQGTIVL